MVKNDKIFDVKLDAEEQELAEEIARGEWITCANSEEEAVLAKEAATNYLRKNQRINIRLPHNDLMLLKKKASYKGLPYQTLIASVLHEYAAGHFEEKR